eukprot:73654_1
MTAVQVNEAMFKTIESQEEMAHKDIIIDMEMILLYLIAALIFIICVIAILLYMKLHISNDEQKIETHYGNDIESIQHIEGCEKEGVYSTILNEISLETILQQESLKEHTHKYYTLMNKI